MENNQLILELRKRTALPLLKCRQLLIETNWDIEKAVILAHNKYRGSIGIMDDSYYFTRKYNHE